jgi:YidC/Oxa1 family membrane protein insertase
MFEIPAAMLSWFYGHTNSYIIAIALMSVIVMAITTPLTLKSTKGMLEMQKLSPEMRRLQNEHRNDKTKLNEEMMKLYQENKVNPMSSCLPIFAQMPVFIVMFRILRGWTYQPDEHGEVDPIATATLKATGTVAESFPGFIPRYMSVGSDLFQSIYQSTRIEEIGLDLSQSPAEAISANPLAGIIYALLVVALGGLYFGQQRMVAARAAVSPTMSPTQQKVMQYLPVVFAVFQIFFLTALVIYYIFQTLLRILQQYYITKKFYGEDGLGRQAQQAGEEARAQQKESGESGGFLAQAKRDLAAGRPDKDGGNDAGKKANDAKGTKPSPSKGARPTGQSKRVTPPKSRPTAGGKNGSSGGKGRPTPTRKEAEAAKNRPKPSRSSGKKKKK